MPKKNMWKPVPRDDVEIEGPYECPHCAGHVMLDATYLDQVELKVVCPYCRRVLYVEVEPLQLLKDVTKEYRLGRLLEGDPWI